MTGRPSAYAPLIALVGADGCGKSTLTAALLPSLRRLGPAETCYLGLGSDLVANRVRRIPLVGALLDRAAKRKAARARNPADRIPGVLTALVIYAFSRRRLRSFKRMMALRREGVVVLTDRYPQLDVAGFYDGPGLGAARAGDWFVKWLAARERGLYEYMAGFRPDLVVRLNVSPAVASARKPDHDPGQIAAKVAVTPALRFNGAPIIDLDADQALEAVLAESRDAIITRLAALRSDRARTVIHTSGKGTP